MHSTPIAAAGSQSSISTLGNFGWLSGILFHSLRENPEGSDSAHAAGFLHESKPPGRFGSVRVQHMSGCPMKAISIAKTARDQSERTDPGSPIVIERMKGPIIQFGGRSGIGADGRTQKPLSGTEGEGRNGRHSIEPFLSFFGQPPSVQYGRIATASADHPQGK